MYNPVALKIGPHGVDETNFWERNFHIIHNHTKHLCFPACTKTKPNNGVYDPGTEIGVNKTYFNELKFHNIHSDDLETHSIMSAFIVGHSRYGSLSVLFFALHPGGW